MDKDKGLLCFLILAVLLIGYSAWFACFPYGIQGLEPDKKYGLFVKNGFLIRMSDYYVNLNVSSGDYKSIVYGRRLAAGIPERQGLLYRYQIIIYNSYGRTQEIEISIDSKEVYSNVLTVKRTHTFVIDLYGLEKGKLEVTFTYKDEYGVWRKEFLEVDYNG